MPIPTEPDLRDPMPPVPGERERALVATRAHRLGRRRRLAQGAGALALVAAVSVSVAALTAGGASAPGDRRIEAAASPADSTAPATAPPTTPATTPATTVAPALPPAPAPDAAPAAPQAPPAASSEAPAPVAPTAFTVSGTVGNFPAGHTVTLRFDGPGGMFTTTADGAGHFSVSGLAAGTYSVISEHVDPSGTATTAERLGSVTIDGNTSVALAFA